MKKRDHFLSLNKKQESTERFLKNNIIDSQVMKEYEKYVKTSSLNDSDIQLIINELTELPCCLNEFLEKTIKEPKGAFQLLEIRKRNIKIKMHFSESLGNNNILCNWCNKKCPKSETLKEKEINFVRTNSKICCCGIKDHNISRQKSNLTANPNDKKEIDEIVNSIKD